MQMTFHKKLMTILKTRRLYVKDDICKKIDDYFLTQNVTFIYN